MLSLYLFIFNKCKYYFFKNFTQKLNLSKEIFSFFKTNLARVSENLKRPILSCNLFFITLFELKKFKYSKNVLGISKKCVNFNNTKYALFKIVQTYKKCIKVKKNLYYFYFLTQKIISSNDFETLIKNKNINKFLSFFRFALFNKMIRIKISKKFLNQFANEILVFNLHRI